MSQHSATKKNGGIGQKEAVSWTAGRRLTPLNAAIGLDSQNLGGNVTEMRRSVLKSVFTLACLAIVASALSPSASAESVWKKMKIAALQQACRGGDQQACKELVKMGQAPAQTGQPQAGHSGQQPPKPGHPSQQANQIPDQGGPFKAPAGTKIEEKILAPVQQDAKFVVSPHGVHVATVETDGSRAVVWYDGVEGPKFDEILKQETSQQNFSFSPDGNRYGYCARSGSEMVVMVDGKELARTPESEDGIFNCQIGFTSNSKHVFYLTHASVGGISIGRFAFDGKSDPPGGRNNQVNSFDFRMIAFSPDGDHYAYVWNDPHRQKPWMLIVDGKPAPYQGGGPQWTNDNKHLYTQRTGSGFTELLLDGKPIARAFNFRVYIPPVGNMVVVAVTGGTNFHPYSFLVVNGKKIPGSDTVERGMIDNVVFSPDGKHYAAIYGDLNAHHYVFADGKRGEEYVSVTDLAFTADSSTLVYNAGVNGKQFVVVGDKEFTGSDGLKGPALAPAGNRVASFLMGNGTESVLIDGKVTPLGPHGGSDLSFSPDGKHVAFVAGDSVNSSHLMLDGNPLGQFGISGDRIDPANVMALHYVFSPDSEHVAYFAQMGDAHGIGIDGKFIATPGQGNISLRFSPDGKHLLWLHLPFGNAPYRLIVDGKPLLDFFIAGNTLATTPRWWDFNPDGTLSLLAQDDNSLKRITITFSPDTSVATLLGARTTIAQRN